MKYIPFLTLLALSCLLCSCNNSNDQNAANQKAETLSTEASLMAPPPDEELDLPIGYSAIRATYKSCAVYASAMDFYFINDDGEGLDFRISNTDGFTQQELDEMAKLGTAEANGLVGLEIQLHEDMVDNNDQLEGPPGANPEMIDQPFWLIYNEHGKLVEVRKQY